MPRLERAETEGLSFIKVHSHPTGFPTFSTVDDIGDERLLPMLWGWIDADVSVGSAVMLPNGQMFGRVLRRRQFRADRVHQRRRRRSSFLVLRRRQGGSFGLHRVAYAGIR